tara:strand:+ start:7705 stop:8247 length:543 start_codon:yes stop_codon:yes gene_type:complete
MKLKTLILPLALFIATSISLSACKDKKSETLPTDDTEVAIATYKCPMNCEDGKTYTEAGTCPVCKMNLMAVDQESKNTCAAYTGGECKCESGTCTCVDCPKKNKEMKCAMHEDGKKCENSDCKEHRKQMSCTMHKDGGCKCEGEKCACTNCKEHSKQMTCTMHKDGEKCEDADCKEHAKQ